jgi:excinuclease ABC subunit C
MVDSLLDGIAGLGPARRRALLARFGSLKRLRAAGVDEIAAVPGIGRQTAQAVAEAVAQRRAVSAVNMATGEILDPEPSDQGGP